MTNTMPKIPMSKTACIAVLKKKSRSDPQIEHLKKMEAELFALGSDRATVVMFGSFLEDSLKKLLILAMRDNINSDDINSIFGDRGIAGSFSSKITTSWAFSLIGPIVRSDLNLIREVRNAAAHSRLPFSFLTKEVSDVCGHLKIVEDSSTYIPFTYLEHLNASERTRAESLDYPKTRFITSCHFISYRIHQKINGPVAGDIAFQGELLP